MKEFPTLTQQIKAKPSKRRLFMVKPEELENLTKAYWERKEKANLRDVKKEAKIYENRTKNPDWLEELQESNEQINKKYK